MIRVSYRLLPISTTLDIDFNELGLSETEFNDLDDDEKDSLIQSYLDDNTELIIGLIEVNSFSKI